MKVVITDYQYENIDSERSIITGAGYELFDYQVKTTPDLIPVVKDADAVITQYSDINAEVIEHMQELAQIILIVKLLPRKEFMCAMYLIMVWMKYPTMRVPCFSL